MIRSAAVAALFCLLVGCASAAPAAQTLSYRDLLGQLTDLDRLTLPDSGEEAGIASSWDRREHESWGSNGDSGQYIRVDPDGEAVMMDEDGPGCIYRLWSANPQGKIRIYLDGAATPSYEWDFSKLFSGTIHPFIKPLVFQRAPRDAAADSFIPIPFAKHIKVTADKKYGQYYHLNYLKFPKDWTVPSFHLPLSADEEAALTRAAASWSELGTDPKPIWPGQRRTTGKLTLRPGRSVTLVSTKGSGEIRAIRLRVKSTARRPWRKLVLRGTWDGAKWPQVLSPIGPFFGFDWDQPEFSSLISGNKDGVLYFYYPMPYKRSARLELTSFLEGPADVEYEIETAPDPQPKTDRLYFFARWRHEPKAVPFDYTFIETAGHGHLVGITQQTEHPIPGWFGEGDEKVWVDGDGFPRWIGTGTEDYYGDAWGLHQGSQPLFGDGLENGLHSTPYRWHFMDRIPFYERLRMTIENYGPNGSAAPHEYEHNSVAFWYQQELTPPFEQLAGKTYLGSQVMGVPPSTQHYQTDRFVPLDADSLRSTGLGTPFALEAEDLMGKALPRGARIVTDGLTPYELNSERAVDFGLVKTGQDLGEVTLTVPSQNVYFLKALIAPLPDSALLKAETDGGALGGTARPQPNIQDLGGVALTAGAHRMKLTAASPGRLVLDAIQLQPAARVAEVMEGEELPIVGGAAHPSAPMGGVSAGRVLELAAAAPGQGATVRVGPAREWPFTLAVRPMLGPDAGIVQAFVEGKAIGPAQDLYAAEARPSPSTLPLGVIGKDVKDVEIRVVGKNERSAAYHAGLDYFRLEPVLLGPGTPPDVSARVLRTVGCEYRPQALGAAWYSGNQLWIQPSRDGAFVEIGIDLPREGDWDLSTRLTTSWDYARVATALDGKSLGAPQDCYSMEVSLAPPTDFGKMHLTAGRHVLRLTAAGKNADSKGYLMGVDYISVVPAE